MPLQPEQVLNNRYRIIKLLGQGGFGAVYQAWDANLNRACALKENFSPSPEAVRQFAREATVLANLSHPGLPRVIDHFTVTDVGHYLVMDFIEGDDLETMMTQQGLIPLNQAVAWASQVLDALAYLHSRKPPVVHRDIKPANIRITPEGQAVLVDFGLVKIYDANMQTTLGARAVTPGYAPPEQYGQGSTDPRTDVYALGATLYKLLTGKEPMESVRRMVGGKMRTANEIDPQIPPPISQAIERAMAIEPDQRFQSAADFKAALHYSQPAPFARGSTVLVRPPAEVYARPVAESYPHPAVMEAPPAAEPRPESRKLALGAGAVVVIALCLVATSILAGWYIKQQTTQATATQVGVPTQTAAQKLEFGPASGELVHDTADPAIEAVGASVNLRDFIVEARFYNPFSSEQGSWDYGFVFRHEGENRQFRLVLKSDGAWLLLNNAGDTEGTTLKEGTYSGLNLNEGGSNLVRLVCEGETGTLYINGAFITGLDLSARMNAGNIFIVTGIYEGDEIDGKSTRYEEFSVWSIP